jgi:hypothetical protein
LKLALMALAGLVLQAGVPGASTDSALNVQHLRYERALTVPSGSDGVACAVLDGTTFAHAASRSADDLRVMRAGANGVAVETPFALTESAAQPVDVATAAVQNLGMRGGNVDFDLVMPHRAYSEVDLQLNAKDFVATAKVSGLNGTGDPSISLGSFALFDLTSQGLSRSTALPLQESTFARLHVSLHVMKPGGAAFAPLTPAIVEGATVPASREAQTLYTVVAQTSDVQQEGSQSIAKLATSEHVPIERVSFVLDPAFKRDFLRNVTVTAGAGADQEVVTGEIERVTRTVGEGEPPIRSVKLSVDAVMASNLRNDATMTVAVKNGNDQPLPIRAVQLEMRQRTVCFEAKAGNTYTLRYGDVALHAPVYDFARLYTGERLPMVAVLGPEALNPEFRARADDRPYSERHPEVLWIALLAVVAALGATALHGVRQQGR